MTPLLIPYPAIDPVLVQLGPFAIRWYALAYIAGLVLGWRIIRRVCEQPPKVLSATRIDDFLLWAALGVILGGRIGYVLFYKPAFFLSSPLSILTLWEGGMSFHGGLLGVITAILAFAWVNKINPFMLSDLVAIVAPIGLFFGRLANFINGELWGRPTDVPWAMIFPRGGPLPRHPSQLYQAFFEGVLLFALVVAVWHWSDGRRRPGLLHLRSGQRGGVARRRRHRRRSPDLQRRQRRGQRNRDRDRGRSVGQPQPRVPGDAHPPEPDRGPGRGVVPRDRRPAGDGLPRGGQDRSRRLRNAGCLSAGRY